MGECPRCNAPLGDDARFCPFDGTPIVPRSDPIVGRVLAGRYRINARIGAGGMATVYLARHQGLDRDVALKLLHPAVAADHRSVSRFALEARAAARMNHENVVHVFDFGYAEDGFCYLAMEHVQGTTLGDEIMNNGPLSPRRASHVLAQIAVALAHAHAIGIIHRDLKPDNVLLTRRGSDHSFVKILDFGLAKMLAPRPGEPPLTLTGEIFGTPEYMAPEQWSGKPTDARTDVYAFGATAFEVLTGTVPFEGDGIGIIMDKHFREPTPSLRERYPALDAPPALEEIVTRALQKEPDRRYQSFDAVLQALGHVWKSMRPTHRHATYSGTAAAPPAPSLDSVPDPTAYQSSDLNVVWDGPSLCDEIGRLHAIRARRFQELAAALWAGNQPEEVSTLQHQIELLERDIEEEGKEVALLRARVEELDVAARNEEGHWRSELIDASLELSVLARRLPKEVTSQEVDLALEDTHEIRKPPSGAFGLTERRPPSAPPPPNDPEARVRYAERRIASLYRHHLRDDLELREALERHIAHMRELEEQVQPLQEQLAGLVQKAARGRRELRQHLVEFGKIDGALASYQALLAGLEAG